MVKLGGSPFTFDKARPTRFGVLPRTASDASEIRWFETEPLVAFHTVGTVEAASSSFWCCVCYAWGANRFCCHTQLSHASGPSSMANSMASAATCTMARFGGLFTLAGACCVQMVVGVGADLCMWTPCAKCRLLGAYKSAWSHSHTRSCQLTSAVQLSNQLGLSSASHCPPSHCPGMPQPPSSSLLPALHAQANAWQEGDKIKLYLCTFEEVSCGAERGLNAG